MINEVERTDDGLAYRASSNEISHEKVAEMSGDIAKATRVAAGIAAAGAAVAAPTGLSAVGVALV